MPARRGGDAVRRKHRRIEQHGVFAHQAATRPGGLDEQREERFGDGFGGLDAQDLRAIRRTIARHGDAGHERRPVEAVAREGILRRELGVERREIFRRRVDQLDFRVERRVERRIQMNVAETQCMGDSGQEQQRHQTPGETNTHHSRLHIHRRLCDFFIETKA